MFSVKLGDLQEVVEMAIIHDQSTLRLTLQNRNAAVSIYDVTEKITAHF